MDLGAYAQIENLEQVAEINGISVPRLRGYRLMRDESPLSIDDFLNESIRCAVRESIGGNFVMNPSWLCFGYKEDVLEKQLLAKDSSGNYRIRWELIHGRSRKVLKYHVRKFKKLAKRQVETFNKYVGRDDILYIHARIGGGNWEYFGCRELEKRPWFLEKVDDLFDESYCDIYATVSIPEDFRITE